MEIVTNLDHMFGHNTFQLWDERNVLLAGVGVELLRLDNQMFALHLYTHPAHKRKGHMTRLVEHALTTLMFKGLTWVCEDELRYRELGGIGFCSQEGQAFFDAYRLRHDIRLPETMWDNHRLVRRSTRQPIPWRIG